MLSAIARFLLWLFGWKITGRYPFEQPKMVLAVAPHTSNWDFPLGILVKSAMKIDGKYVGKHTIFRWPFGGFLRWLGGIPVDRTKGKTNFVAAVIEQFNTLDHLHLVIAPEGTRSKVDRFKTGFYHIAKGAGVPILLTTFHFDTHCVDFGTLFYPTTDEQADLDFLWNYFKGAVGKNPEQGIF